MKSTPTIRALFLAVPLMQAAALFAQITPSMGAFQFSDGVHPTVEAVFPGAQARMVESFWKGELKAISIKVEGRKEMIGEAARIPSAKPDTLRIFIKVEQPKGGTIVTAHIAFLTAAGFVGPDSEKRLREGCVEWVRQRMVTLRKQVAQKAFDDGRRELDRQQRKLADLKRDKQRAEDGILRAGQRSDRAVKDKAVAEQQLAQLDSSSTATATDSAAVADAARDRAKQQGKLQDRIKRQDMTIAKAKKKTADLQWEIKKNTEEQAAQQQAVDKQQEAVNGLQEKLQAIQ